MKAVSTETAGETLESLSDWTPDTPEEELDAADESDDLFAAPLQRQRSNQGVQGASVAEVPGELVDDSFGAPMQRCRSSQGVASVGTLDAVETTTGTPEIDMDDLFLALKRCK